jgi:hypothetical protein
MGTYRQPTEAQKSAFWALSRRPRRRTGWGDKSHAEQELYSLKFFRGARMGVEERGSGEPKRVRFLSALGMTRVGWIRLVVYDGAQNRDREMR